MTQSSATPSGTSHSAPEKVSGQLNPNPQGKGLAPVLQDWSAMQPTVAMPRTAGQFLRDYALSSLVLAADFHFKPVPGKTYYLYATEGAWKLSLIAPHEWGDKPIGDFLARCQLRKDMTWDFELDDIAQDSLSARRARNFVLGFVGALNGQASIADHLPRYVAELPYYRRLLASGLASALGAALPAVGGDVRTLLESDQTLLSLLGSDSGEDARETVTAD